MTNRIEGTFTRSHYGKRIDNVVKDVPIRVEQFIKGITLAVNNNLDLMNDLLWTYLIDPCSVNENR